MCIFFDQRFMSSRSSYRLKFAWNVRHTECLPHLIPHTLQNSTAEHSIPEQKTEQSGPMLKWSVCRYAVNRWSTTSSSETPHTHTHTHTHGLNQIESWVVLFCFLFNDDLGRLTATCVEERSRVVMLASFCVTAGFLDVACASKRLW